MFSRRQILAIGLSAGTSLLAQSSGHVVNDDSTAADMKGMSMPAGVDKATQALMAQATPVNAVYPVLTRSYDNLRSCANTHETILSPASIRQAGGLRKLFSVSMPGDKRGAEAQPLLVPNVQIEDGTTHDLLIGCSMANSIWAWDANDGTPLWMSRVGNPIRGSQAIDLWQINDKWGILSTGVISGAFLYLVAWSSPDGTPAKSGHYLFQMNVATGAQVKCLRLVNEVGAFQRKQRAALSYVTIGGRDVVLIPFGTIQETATGAHGFLTVVDVEKFQVTAEFNVTATGKGGGIWQAGQGVAVDSNGDIYCTASNGDFDGVNNWSESFLKLRYDGTSVKVIDYHLGFLDKARKAGFDDMDLGSSGPFLIPELKIVGGAGKDGIGYVLRSDAMHGPPIQQIWLTFYPGNGIPAVPTDKLFFNRSHHDHSGSVVWKSANGWRMFCGGENSNVRAWSADSTGIHYLACSEAYASAQSPVPAGGMAGCFLSLSSDGTKNGVLWATCPDGDANRGITTGRLLAFDAGTYEKYSDGSGKLTQLWASPSYTFNKFGVPVISGGRVFLADYAGGITAYGL